MNWPQIAGEVREGRHILPVRVYYEDTDFSGVVYHAAYLRFMERGRTDYLRLLGVNHRELFAGGEAGALSGFAFAVIAMQIAFRKPARMDDVLEVWTATGTVKGASLELAQKVVRGQETLVTADIRVACVRDGKAQRIPPALRAALQRGEALAPPRARPA